MIYRVIPKHSLSKIKEFRANQLGRQWINISIWLIYIYLFRRIRALYGALIESVEHVALPREIINCNTTFDIPELHIQ